MNLFLRQLGSELWKLFGKKRTYIGFAIFLLAQNLILFLFHYSSRWQSSYANLLTGWGYLASEFISALTVAVLMLLPQVMLLMPLYTTLVGGDLVAKEVEDGTLRMILARPITRLRLIAVKWVTGVIFAALLVLVLGGVALVAANFWFPWKSMVVIGPDRWFNIFAPGEGLSYYALAHVFLAVNAVTMLSLAFMFSCFNVKPAAATILALSFLFLNMVLSQMPFAEDYRDWFLTNHFSSWIFVFKPNAQASWFVGSLSVLLGYNLTAFIIGATAFHVRDFKT